jgi:hypothetical protein
VKAIGRHRAVNRSHRRRSPAQTQVPVRRRPGIEVVDAATLLTHLVTPGEMTAGHKRGNFVGFCGDRFVAASMVEPGEGPCQRCQLQAAAS